MTRLDKHQEISKLSFLIWKPKHSNWMFITSRSLAHCISRGVYLQTQHISITFNSFFSHSLALYNHMAFLKMPFIHFFKRNFFEWKCYVAETTVWLLPRCRNILQVFFLTHLPTTQLSLFLSSSGIHHTQHWEGCDPARNISLSVCFFNVLRCLLPANKPITSHVYKGFCWNETWVVLIHFQTYTRLHVHFFQCPVLHFLGI